MPGGSLAGLFLSQGETWKQQRRFTVKTLGEFGFGKSSMEEMVWEEAERFCDHLSSRLQEPVQVCGLFNISILNILWRMTTGDTFAYDDVKIKQFRYFVSVFLIHIKIYREVLSIKVTQFINRCTVTSMGFFLV